MSNCVDIQDGVVEKDKHCLALVNTDEIWKMKLTKDI